MFDLVIMTSVTRRHIPEARTMHVHVHVMLQEHPLLHLSLLTASIKPP